MLYRILAFFKHSFHTFQENVTPANQGGIEHQYTNKSLYSSHVKGNSMFQYANEADRNVIEEQQEAVKKSISDNTPVIVNSSSLNKKLFFYNLMHYCLFFIKSFL